MNTEAPLTDREGRKIHPSWIGSGEVALAIMRAVSYLTPDPWGSF